MARYPGVVTVGGAIVGGEPVKVGMVTVRGATATVALDQYGLGHPISLAFALSQQIVALIEDWNALNIPAP